MQKCSFCLALYLVVGLFVVSHVNATPEPVRVYLMVGQSNMQGKGSIEGEATNSLRHLVQNDPNSQFQFLVEEDGTWRERLDVSIHYDLYPFRELRYGPLKPGYGASAGQIGPELGFGHVIGDATKGQVLLIKAAWGGKSLGHNFLPPSVGKYTRPIEPDDPGYFYQRILQLAREVSVNIETYLPGYKGQGVEISGLCWHQGWNDQYGGLDANYEPHLEAFIRDIRSAEHGLGVADLPIVIASSGMISNESPVVQGQLAIGDTKRYPQFAGNIAVINTDKPYGPDKMAFKFYTENSPDKVSYHWNNHAHSYLNIGRAMAAEMLKLDKPNLPARLLAHGCEQGVQLIWQLGSEKPESVYVLRNGKRLDAKLSPTQSAYIDTTALPGPNKYELVFDLPSGKLELSASCDTSATDLSAYRSMQGVMLNWKARGKYDGFRITRNDKVIVDHLAADLLSFEDKDALAKGKVRYAVEPTTGKTTPAELVVNLGPIDADGALIYEPFDYPSNVGEPQSILGKGGAIGTKGVYIYLGNRELDRAPATLARGLSFGALPVTGNRGSSHRWCNETYIELD
ncbi:MAG: sialate O-acetylesterase, partial [Phycisphaeraceae bacterium]